MSNKLGEEKVYQFRRSWDLRPDPLDRKSSYHPLNIETYKNIPTQNIPDTESLKIPMRELQNILNHKLKIK